MLLGVISGACWGFIRGFGFDSDQNQISTLGRLFVQTQKPCANLHHIFTPISLDPWKKHTHWDWKQKNSESNKSATSFFSTVDPMPEVCECLIICRAVDLQSKLSQLSTHQARPYRICTHSSGSPSRPSEWIVRTMRLGCRGGPKRIWSSYTFPKHRDCHERCQFHS